MSIAPWPPRNKDSFPDVGSTLCTPQSPLSLHLQRLGDASPGAASLRRELDEKANARTKYLNPGPDIPCSEWPFLVKCYDLTTANTITCVHTLSWDHFDDKARFAQRVNGFLENLKEPTVDAHLRVMVLDKYHLWWEDKWDYEKALHLHIMIIELGISPELAANMLQLSRSHLTERWNALEATALLSHRSISLGPQSCARSQTQNTLPWHVAATYLGSRDLAGRSVHTVLICSDGPRFKQHLIDAILGPDLGLARPGSIDMTSEEDSSFLSRKSIREWKASHFESYLFNDESDSSRQIAAGKPTCHWINALMRMVIFRYSIRPWMLGGTPPSRNNDDNFESYCQMAGAQSQAAKMDLVKLEAFFKQNVDFERKDCALALESLRTLVGELQSDYENLSAAFGRRSTLRSLEMARLSINESRSTIRLTWLATIFVPISLASSIFGMNVQEIDASTTGIWQFAATAAVLLALSGYSWCVSRAWHNYRLCLAHLQDRHPKMYRWPVQVYQVLYRQCYYDHVRTMRYFLGFSRVEELGLRDKDDET